MVSKYEFKLIAIDSLETVDFNPNEMTKSQMEHLRKTIKERGFMQPLTITPKEGAPGKYTVIDGAHRLEVFKELKRSSIPCYIVPDKKMIDIKVDMINLNKIHGEFNQDKYNSLLSSIMDEIEIGKMKELLLLEKEDLKSFENYLNEKNKIDLDPETIEVSSYERAKSKTKIQLGDIYLLGNHRLMCGDSTKESNVESLMNGTKADMVFTDPPSNVDYGNHNNPKYKPNDGAIINDNLKDEDWRKFQRKWLSIIKDILVGSIYICMGSKNGPQLREDFLKSGFHWSSDIIWVKDRFVIGRKDYNSRYESLIYGWVEGKNHYWCNNDNLDDIWEIKRNSSNELHPTMKPLELISKAILNSCRVDNIILDLFGGSGSTIMTCEQLNRKCYMMEIDPVYCQIIIDRWQDYTGKKATKEL